MVISFRKKGFRYWSFMLCFLMMAGAVSSQNLEITQPSNSSYSQNPDFNFTETGSANLTSVNFSLNSNSNFTTAESGGFFVNSSHNVSEGVQSLRVYGRNDSGDLLTATKVFTYDITPPSANLSSLPSGPVSEFNVNATYSDGLSGIDSTYFNLSNSTGAVYEASFNASVSNLSTGSYNLSYRFGDNAGNYLTNLTVANISVDSTPPFLNLTSPSDGETVSGFFGVNATYGDQNDVESAMYEVQTYSGDLNASFNSSKIEDGSVELSVNATDSAGNRQNKTIQISVDNHPPRVSDLDLNGDEPEDGQRIPSENSVEWSFSDAGSSVEVSNIKFVNGSGSTEAFSSESFEVQLEEDFYNLTFDLMDESGSWNNSTYVEDLEVDSTPPSVEVGKLPQGWSNGAAEIFFNCSGESGEDVEGAVYGGSETVSGWGEVPRNVTVESPGNNTYEFTCSDDLGNSASEDRSVEIDTMKPSIGSADPFDSGGRLDPSFDSSFNFTDRHSGIDSGSGRFWIRGQEGRVEDVSWSGSRASFSISGLRKSSSYTLKGYVLDTAGNNFSFSEDFRTERLPEDLRNAEIIREKMSLGAVQFDLSGIDDNTKIVMNVSGGALRSLRLVTDSRIKTNSLTVTETSSSGEDEVPESGEVFRYFAAEPERSLEFEEMEFRVAVSREWMNSTGVNSSSLGIVARKGSNWTEVNTSVVRADSRAAVIKAYPDTFSRYAVVARGGQNGGLSFSMTSGFMRGFQNPQNWISLFLVAGTLFSVAYLLEELGYIDLGLVERFQSHL